MKRLIILLLSFCAFTGYAQTTIYSQNFNTGTATDWSLNTADLGGDVSLSDNQWVINNSYAGGFLSGIIPVVATANEPAGIVGYPNSYYMHVFSAMGVSLGGPDNCNFDASGSGTIFTAQNTPISTLTYTSVTLYFWWLCRGNASSCGKVYYRTSAGGAWTQIMSPVSTFYNSAAWNRDSVNLPAFAGQAFLEFGFEFNDGGAGNDPAFAIDDILVTGTSSPSGPTITTNPSNSVVCSDISTSFNVVATGATSYQWQRSTTGIAGPFVNITTGMDGGIYGASFTTATLVVTTPTAVDNGYAYQVIATNGTGSTTSTAALLTVTSAPSAGTITGSNTICITTTTNLSDATGVSGGTWSSSSVSIATVSASGVVTGVAAGGVIISYTVTNACGTATATFSVTVTTSATAGTITGSSTACIGSTITLSDGTSGGTWSSSSPSVASITAGGVVTGIAVGSTVMSYSVTGPCGTAVATYNVTVISTATAGVISGVNIICAGSIDSLNDGVSGGRWTSSNTANAIVDTAHGYVTGITAGVAVITYTITSPCGSPSTTYSVTVNAVPHPVISALPGHTLSVPNVYSSYQWLSSGSNIPGATTHTYVFTVTGSYQVRVDSNGCYTTTAAHTYNLGVNEIVTANNAFGITQAGNNATIFANFALTENLNITVFDATGRLVSRDIWLSGTISKQLNTDWLANGIYVIRLNNENTTSVLKWMKY